MNVAVSKQSHTDKMWVLTAVLLALFLGAIDQTIVAAAAPGIVDDLDGSDRLTWITTSYVMASSALVPIFGKLADLFSRKLMINAAMGIFILGSTLCGLSGYFGNIAYLGDGMNQLVFSRAIQGIGGAGLFALVFVIIADLFIPAERARYQGYTGSVFALASILGPLLGGYLTMHGSIVSGFSTWRWIFLINIPSGFLAMVMIYRLMPRSYALQTEKLDLSSAIFLVSGISLVVFATQLFKANGDRNGAVISLLTGLFLLYFFVRRSLKISDPVLRISLFHNEVFRAATLAIFLMGGAFLGIIIFEPLYIIKVYQKSAMDAGVGLIPFSLGVVLGSTCAGRIVSRYGNYKTWMFGGLLVIIPTLLIMIFYLQDLSFVTYNCCLVLLGIGFGPSMPLYTLAVQNAVERQLIGQATSACQFFRQMGGVFAAAVFGLVLSSSLSVQGIILQVAYKNAVTRVHSCILMLVIAAFFATLKVPERVLKRK